jgi:hypothetical protein
LQALISGAEKSTYDARFEGAKPAPVTVVTFGSPNPGDATWANYFNKKVNARNIAFEGDLVAKVRLPSTKDCWWLSGDWVFSVTQQAH